MTNMTAALRKTLQGRSAEDLARIGEHWAVSDVMLESWSETSTMEGQGMLDIVSARFAWEALSPSAREILHQMIISRVTDGVPRMDLQALSELADDEFVAALSELEQSSMLIEARPDNRARHRLEERGQQIKHVLFIPKDFINTFSVVHEEIYGKGDRSKMQLTEVLALLDSSKLQVIEALTSSPIRGNNFGFYLHNATPASLAGKLVQPDIIAAIWDKLDAIEQKICRWLCRADGSSQVAEVQAALNLSRPTMARYVYRLENYGLAFSTFSGQEYRIFIGRGIFKVLRKLIGELDAQLEQARKIASMPLELETAPVIVHEAHSNLLSDLAIVVNSVYQMVIEPTQAGRVPKRLANKIFPLLHGSRPAYYEENDYYLDMVFTIADSLKLIEIQENLGQKARYVPGPKLGEWTRLEAYEQIRCLLEVWQRAMSRAWSDVAGVDYRPDSYGYGHYIEMQSSRQGLLEYLAEHCQPGRWYALAPFLQTIKTLKPLLLREHSRYANYGGIRGRKDILANWDQVDGEIITGMLSSSLHELGLVTLGHQTDFVMKETAKFCNPDAFQFTELAAQAIWNIHTAEQKANASKHNRNLIVQPNFELLLLQPDYLILYKLLPFARINQAEIVSRLTLTQESVRRGVEAGCGIEEILRTLQAFSQKELPQNVLYTLQDWGKLYKDATVSQIILLEVSSEAVADEICSSSKLRSLDLRRLGPCAIAVGGQVSLQVLRTTLEKEGVILHIQGDILSAREFASTTISGYGRRR